MRPTAGERFVIERDHRPVAVLVSVEEARRLDADPEERRRRSIAALDRLEAIGRDQQAGHPGGPSAVDAVRMDRDRDGG